MKQMIQQKLIANVIMDKCAEREYLIFQSAWCSQERVIRFTTPFFRRLFPITDSTAGKWKTGDAVMYEVDNGTKNLVVRCIHEPIEASVLQKGVLKSWDLTNSDVNALFDAFDAFIDKTLPQFEKELDENLKRQDGFVEGEEKTVLSTKYERNSKARAACLAHYGYTCKVCGMNFEDVYGSDFKEIIEVHHIIPISQIGKNYVVDPINDLVPVCPNCHAALHSKAGDRLKIKIN